MPAGTDYRVKIDFGTKRLVGDAHAAQHYLVVLTADGAPALALVHRDHFDRARVQGSELIDQTRRAATVDFTGVEPAALIAGPSVAPALRDLELLGALYVAAEAAGSSEGGAADSYENGVGTSFTVPLNPPGLK